MRRFYRVPGLDNRVDPDRFLPEVETIDIGPVALMQRLVHLRREAFLGRRGVGHR